MCQQQIVSATNWVRCFLNLHVYFLISCVFFRCRAWSLNGCRCCPNLLGFCLFACVFLNCSVWALRVTVQLPYQKRNYAPAYGQQLSHRVLVNILHRNKVVVIVCYNGITQLITECMSCDIKPNLGINKYRNFPLCKQKRNCCSCFVLVWFLSQLVGLGQSTKNTG